MSMPNSFCEKLKSCLGSIENCPKIDGLTFGNSSIPLGNDFTSFSNSLGNSITDKRSVSEIPQNRATRRVFETSPRR